MMRFNLTANSEAHDLFPRLAGGRGEKGECAGTAFDAWLQGKKVTDPGELRKLDEVLELFSLLSSPLQLQSQTKTSTTGAVLDFRGLLRFYASGGTDMRIFKARAESDQSYVLYVQYSSPEVQGAIEQALTTHLELMSAENGHLSLIHI